MSDPWAKPVHTSLTTKAASCIAVSLILSKLDYCNSLLAGLPQAQIKHLQAGQNAATRTMMKCMKTDHIIHILNLRQLHWLPNHDCIHHKLLSATYLSVHGNASPYLSEHLHFYTPSHLLRSASRSILDVQRPKDSKTKWYGQQSSRYVALFLSGMSSWKHQGKLFHSVL